MKVSGQSFSLTALVTPGWTYVCVCVCATQLGNAHQNTPYCYQYTRWLAWMLGARYISVSGDALMNAATGQVHPWAHPWDVYVNYVTYTTTRRPLSCPQLTTTMSTSKHYLDDGGGALWMRKQFHDHQTKRKLCFHTIVVTKAGANSGRPQILINVRKTKPSFTSHSRPIITINSAIHVQCIYRYQHYRTGRLKLRDRSMKKYISINNGAASLQLY